MKKVCKGFSKVQMKKGIKIEMEHTHNPRIARKIATAHLSEYGNYYSYLPKAEKQMAKAQKGKCHFKAKKQSFML
jgi:hypothetical protein